MEDILLREIERTGKVLEAILMKLGLMRQRNETGSYAVAAAAAKEGLGIELTPLLADPEIARTLVAVHGFGESDLEKFAQMLYLLAATASDDDTRHRTAAASAALYRHLEAHGSCCFFDRYYILRELERYL